MLQNLTNDIIQFIDQYSKVFVVLNILLGLAYKAYLHIKDKRAKQTTPLETSHRTYTRRRKITAAQSKYRKRPHRTRQGRMRKKA